HCGLGSGGGNKLASKIALVYSARLSIATCGKPSLKRIISPCSVTLKPPFNEPGGCDNKAACAGKPPRPFVPPRPWNKVNVIPCLSHKATKASCALYCAQEAAITPASFAESE